MHDGAGLLVPPEFLPVHLEALLPTVPIEQGHSRVRVTPELVLVLALVVLLLVRVLIVLLVVGAVLAMEGGEARGCLGVGWRSRAYHVPRRCDVPTNVLPRRWVRVSATRERHQIIAVWRRHVRHVGGAVG